MPQKISQQNYQRMQGLASVKQMQALNKAMDSLTSDWLKEGFDAEDVKAFMEQRTNEMIHKFERDRSIAADLEAQSPKMGKAKI